MEIVSFDFKFQDNENQPGVIISNEVVQQKMQCFVKDCNQIQFKTHFPAKKIM